jgi:hypothetical protein
MSFHTTDSAHAVTFFPMATSEQEATVAILQDYAIHTIHCRLANKQAEPKGTNGQEGASWALFSSIPITVVWGAVMAAGYYKDVNDLVNGQALAAFSL